MPISNNSLAEWICKKRFIHRSIREFLTKIIAPRFNDGHHFETDFFGLIWPGITSNYIDYQVLLRGAYEKFMLFFMRDAFAALPREEAVFLDVGANIGNHSLFMSKYATTVHSFEPYAPARNILENKIKINQLKNIIVHPVGLSSKNETIPFYPPNLANLGTGSFEKEYCADNEQAAVSLMVVVGDEEIAGNKITGISLIKIDVEGHERQVIDGLNQTIKDNRPIVIFESSPATRDSLATFESMTALFPEDYSFYIFALKNKKTGRYRLAKITSLDSLKNNEIIAMPHEKFNNLQ
ncbi:MAG: FkbM family methyltransferase [Proteobacteria bacterium]|nr:FkbM family methyltransferase [Pseudomonadota bacterium]MBU1714465.1 FkbM family methyltransferase [Pseudomonadota bacterium]